MTIKKEGIRLFEMFAGYGGASFALQKAGIPFECVGYSEIDKNAIKLYEQNHQGINFGDCSAINECELPDFDLLTGGFPCQDVSIAGKRDLSKGRTNLYLQILRIAVAKKPKYMLLENVKGLLSMKDNSGWLLIDKIVRDLKAIGYGVAYKVLNSKDYGTPQNRERVWILCKLGGWDFMEFQWPEKEKLNLFVKDILEDEVDKKYFLKENQIKRILQSDDIEKKRSSLMARKRTDETPVIMNCLTEAIGRQGSSKEYISSVVKLNQALNDKKVMIYDDYNSKLKEDDIACTLTQNVGSSSERNGQKIIIQPPMILDLQNDKIKEDVCICLTDPKHNNLRLKHKEIIRRLTPRECFRLMGFSNDEIKWQGISDSGLYKMAGNGWDVNLVSKIFKQVFKQEKTIEVFDA